MQSRNIWTAAQQNLLMSCDMWFSVWKHESLTIRAERIRNLLLDTFKVCIYFVLMLLLCLSYFCFLALCEAKSVVETKLHCWLIKFHTVLWRNIVLSLVRRLSIVNCHKLTILSSQYRLPTYCLLKHDYCPCISICSLLLAWISLLKKLFFRLHGWD